MKKENASVSIFLSFILVMIISVIMSITEIARIKVLKLYLQIYSDVAVDSMLSLYHRKLWDFYRIFSVENLNDDLLKNEYIEYLENNLEDENRPISNWFASKFNREKFELSYERIIDGYNFEDNINEYMKYAVIEKTIKLFNTDKIINRFDDVNLLLDTVNEIKGNVERKIIYRDIEKKYFNFNKDIEKIEKAANGIKKSVEKINKEFIEIKNIQTSASESNIKTVKSKLNSLCKNINSLVNSIDAYFENMDLLREKVLTNREKFNQDALKEEIDIETLDFINSEFLEFEAYTEKSNEMNLSVERLKTQLNNIKKDIFDFNSIVDDLGNEIEELNLEKKELRRDKENDNTEIIKDINEAIKNIQNDIKQCFVDIKEFFKDLEIDMPSLMLSEKDYESEKNIIESIFGLTENGILSLVLEKEDIEKLSNEINKKIELSIDSREDIKTKFLEILYCMDFMNYYKKIDLNEVTNSGSNKLEVEEIISKKDNDRRNLSSVLFRILLIRECMNVLYIYTNADMKRTARMFTNTTFFFLSPIARRAVNFLVISAWGVAQSIEDLRNIMSGQYVKFFHDSNSWTFNIDDLLNFGNKKNLFRESDDGLVLNYKDYLMVLLFLETGANVNTTMCKIMDYNLKREQENFDMRKNLVSFSVKNSFTSEHFFTNMLFLKPRNFDTLLDINIEINSYGKYFKK